MSCGVCFRGSLKPLPPLLPDLNSCFLAQAADSDYEESDDLFVGPVGTSELSACPCGSPKATQENNVTPDVRGPGITSYKESDLVVEPQKVKMEQECCLAVFSRDLCPSPPG